MFNILVPDRGHSEWAYCIKVHFRGQEDATRALARMIAGSANAQKIEHWIPMSGAYCIIDKDGLPVSCKSFEPLGACACLEDWYEQTRYEFDHPQDVRSSGTFKEPHGGWVWSWEEEGWLSPSMCTNFKTPAILRLHHAVETLVGWETDPICLETSSGPSLSREHWENIASQASLNVLEHLFEAANHSGIHIFNEGRLLSLREKLVLLESLPESEGSGTSSQSI